MESAHRSHLERYHFAAMHAKGKTVLDIGCADGSGTALLAAVANHIEAIDNDEGLIAEARAKHPGLLNVAFGPGDGRSLAFPDNYFDVAVAFEIIEHLPFDEQPIFLKELQRVVKEDGTVIISTPDHNAMMQLGIHHPRNAGHGHPGELTFPQFFYAMNHYFAQLQFYGQFFYKEPSMNDRLKNAIKRADILKLRKLIPAKVRNEHNPSVQAYEQDTVIRPLDGPAAQLLAIGTNKKSAE